MHFKMQMVSYWNSAVFSILTSLLLVHIFDGVLCDANYPLTQPQIYIENGNIHFIPAEHKNVVLKTNGNGKILFNNIELTNILSSVQNSSRDLNAFKNIFGSPSSSSSQVSSRISNIEETIQRLNQIDSIDRRITVIERRLIGINSSEEGTGSRVNNRIRRLKNRIEALERRFRGVGSSDQSPCYNNPCSNGGTCIPTIYGAFCYCPNGWEGERCNQDVNECANFAGTDLGCQNGATCVNQPGSYQCQCRSGYFGIHCTKRSGDCSSGSSYELCGHGVCVNQHSGPSPYTCICDAGWTHNGRSPACNVDVDECTQYHTSCSTNPPVSCINTPGSYVCGPCPPGYTGNGHQCMDINECLVNNGGCSVNPMVQCTNTMGSRTCGTCPPGYMGNGIMCQYVGMCHMNNGGCHPLARCVDNPMIGQSFVQCSCPPGFTGTGMGLHGCIPHQNPGGGGGGGSAVIPTLPPSGNPCLPNPCQNGGVCHSYGTTFSCSCIPGFVGQTCNVRSNPCLSSPCQNGGTCQQTPSGFTCSCTSAYAGDLCERQVESCGGFLSAEEGVLRYPQSQGTYDHNTFCEWIMHTVAGKVFTLNFTNFHLEGGTRCSYDYLEIRDGTDSTSPLIGRYCGDDFPNGGSIVSTHNVLHMIFRSDHNVAGLGFEFTWNSTDPICGGIIENKTHGSIMSPGYPGKYPHDRDCTWQIRASLGKRIQLVFASFQMESHPNCSYDYLEIRDGLEDNAPILEKLCNTTVPLPVTSSGPYLSIRFHSDDSSSDQGFLITFTEMPGVPGCGGLLTDASAVFSSPQHPQPYAHGLECDWLIRLPSRDERIKLQFLTFDIESGYLSCVYDFVEIHDGPSLDSPLVGRFCGNDAPPPYTSRSNQLFVRFKSDESVALGGFSAKYEPVCGGVFSSLDGTLRSPFYPREYPHLRDCVYLISLPAGKGVNLQFLDFDVEAGYDTNCFFDFVEIRDGDNENSTLIGHFCGPPQAAPEIVTSSFNYLWLRFKTDGSISNKGFLANYSSFDLGCGGILRDPNGIISSPGHPEVYPHGVRCMWVIRGDPGQIVRLTWDTFFLESGFKCQYDSVEIYDNSTAFANGSMLIGRYCGREHPPIITSSDTTLTVIFKSDHDTAQDGFMASYRLLNTSTVCGGNFFTEYGVLKSPRYPQNYPHRKTCVWVITAPRGRQIQLNITDFDMEEGTSSACRYDYLEIRNGPHPTSPLIGKFCGNRPPPQIIPSFSNGLYLKFSSDSSHSRKGFMIEWDATSTGCGGVLNSLLGSITSPNYPTAYGGSMECVWKIFVNQGSSVRLSFVDIDLQHGGSNTCWGERVEVLDGVDRSSKLIGKYCSEDHIISLQSESNSVTVKFISIFGTSGRGFQLNYRSECNRVLKGFQGVIESPNYPNAYPHNRNCTWVIEANRGNKVNISFSHFDVEGPYRGNCSYDFVQISEWKRFAEDNKTVIGTYCGNDRPRLISSSLDTVAISFVSDYSHALNGFRLEWKQHGCGGRIIGDFGVLRSPDYPRKYPHNVECVWQITTEIGSKVELTLYELDIEHSENCYWDALMVYGGPDETSPLLSKLCETISSPTTVTSHGNNMYVKFSSDSSFASRGFYGFVHQVSGGCGGRYRGSSGYIYSPNFPQSYDHNDDCTWLITMDRNHVVELTFEDFDVERHINCSYDHVAVYDGNSMSDPVLLTHCGNELPNPPVIRSTGYQMLVRLKTDGSAAGRGFKAKYTKGCGARLTGRQSGVITTPNYPSLVPHEMNCSWIIVGESPDDRVTLTFTNMDLIIPSEDVNCTSSNTFVEVLDGEDFDAPSMYKSCGGRMPPSMTSRGNAMILHIVGGHFAGHGFRAVYDFSSSACGGTLTAANGSITSPNFPNGYPPNVECIWMIKASPGNRVQLTFRRFDIETSEFCNNDFVEIHEGSSAGQLLGHYCGNEVPSNVTAAEKIWLLFRTDAEGQAPGFWADYNLLHGAELSGSSGSISSPMYPNFYTGMGTFTWRVTVNESYSVQLSFVTYELDSDDSEDCSYYDSITIYDGFDENAPELLSTCSKEMPDPVVSTGNVVYIVYNRYAWQKSFLMRWQQVQSSFGGMDIYQPFISGCGGNFSLVSGNATTLTSPGYPLSYGPNMNCIWNFDAPQNFRIKVKVEKLSLDGIPNCPSDRVELYDGVRGLPNYNLNKTLCTFNLNTRNETYLSSGRFLRIVFKTDLYGYYDGFNFTLSAECGGYVRSSRGTISSPNYPNNYVVSDCIWRVVVRPGRTIRVTFNPNFEIYSSSGQCVTDQLMLRNGANDESPFLGRGRYCGTTAPNVLETSGNHLFVHFTSYTHGAKGFAFTYEEVALGCGGTVQLTDSAPFTTVQSPNYPTIPPPFIECEWVFTAPQGEAIQITFVQSFELSFSPGCQNAGVEVRDGGTAIANTLGLFCHEMPGTIKSTGNIMYLRYYTNVPEPRTGFKGEVKIATCGGVHTGRYGTISSPGFPATYEVNMDCVWTIKGPVGTYIVLEFQDFNLGSGDTNCTRDKVNITEQSSDDIIEPRNWTFCGQSDNELPNRIESSTNEIQIRFVSDGQRESQSTGMGFKLRYRARTQYCGGVSRTPTGFIQSPGFPRPYPHYLYCVWRIYAPAGRRIRIEFSDFDLEERLTMNDRRGCYADQLWIYQGVLRAVRAPLYNQSLCGSEIPAPVETTGSEATIYFRTDGSIAHRGFKLQYTTDLPTICGGILEEGIPGNLTSPNMTTNTPNTTTNILCEWKTNSGNPFGYGKENGTTIVTLHRLQVPSWGVRDPMCSHGFVKIAPGNPYVRYKWRRLCGSLTNEKLYVPGDSINVEYVSEDLNSSFSLTYRNVPCGGVLHGPEENVSSLNYPSPYPVDTECIWMVEYSRGSQIKIKFLDLDLEDHQGTDGCDKDYVLIRNGKYPSSPVLGKFCGTNMPSEMLSMSSDLWIEFHSDSSADGSRRGFQIALEQVSHGCGGVIHRKYGALNSPQIDPANTKYPHNTECEWIIESVPGYTVNLVFVDRFEIENSTNCTKDFLEVFQKDEFNWISLGRYCGRQLPAPINSSSTTVKVLFRTNENVNGDGFHLYWYSPCGGIYKKHTGMIRSAHFDSFNHSQHVNPGRFWSYMGWESLFAVHKCDYVIQGNPDDYIVVRFLEPFEVQVPMNYAVSETDLNVHCPRVNVTVQVTSPYGPRPGTALCGRQVPQAFVGKGNVTISYNYQPFLENFGFRAWYGSYDCGGEITEARTITSPGSPFRYADYMNCTWVVKAPQGKVVRFNFNFLELESNNCNWDYVRLYDGVTVQQEKLIGTYCGNLTANDLLPTLKSKTNSMTVIFVSDMTIAHGGFEAAVDFTVGEEQGCGGLKNLTEGAVTLTSIDLDRDGKYDAGLDCQWILTTAEFMSIEITFNSFNLEDSEGQNKATTGSCSLDYLEIRDGPGHYSQLLARLCGSSVPAKVISSRNHVWVRFVTDGTISFSGFSLTARSVPSPCGPSTYIANSTTQYIQSPNYPSNYDNNVRCRWRIEGQRFHQEVDITFIEMDIETAPQCSKDRLEISDVPDMYTSPEGITGPMLFSGSTGGGGYKFAHLNLTMDSILQKATYCGSETPPDFFSIGRAAELVFHSDGSSTRKGFKISFKAAGCNRTYEKQQGRIFSPEWPSTTPLFIFCLSSIRAPNGTTISLYFNSFSLPAVSGQSSCSESALEVRDGSPSGAILAQYCGESIPNPVFSLSNTVYLRFFVRLHPARGYDLTYTTTEMGRGCGGNIFHTGGSFTSPMYPGNYSTDADCTWRVRVPGGLRIQMQFTNFVITGDCQANFVEISALESHNPDAAPVPFTRYCAGDLPGIYSGTTDMAQVRYKTTRNNTGSGWRVTFKGVFPTNVPIASNSL